MDRVNRDRILLPIPSWARLASYTYDCCIGSFSSLLLNLVLIPASNFPELCGYLWLHLLVLASILFEGACL
jgi:hypothetical protein